MSRRFALLSLCFALVLCAGALASTHGAYSAPRDGFSTADGVSVEDTAVYSTGYVSQNGSQWTAFSLTGDVVRGDWVLASASSDVNLQNIRYVAIFSCTWSDGWDCSGTWQVKDRGPQDTVDTRAGDEAALEALSASVTGFDASWDAPISLADPPTGVTVESIGGELRVTQIDLRKMGLGGSLDVPELANLKQMTLWNSAQNRFDTQYPSALHQATSLEYLYITYPHTNLEDGEMPHEQYADQGGITYTNVGKSHQQEASIIRGSVPDDIDNLQNLKWFYLTWTDDWGPPGGVLEEPVAVNGIQDVSQNIWNIPTLEAINIYENWNIAGSGNTFSFPETISHIPNFAFLYAGGGSGTQHWDDEEQGFMAGTYPSDMGQLTKLRALVLSRNAGLSDEFPDFRNSLDFEYLTVVQTDIKGEMPEWMWDGRFNRLDVFAIAAGPFADNRMTGTFPPMDPDSYNTVDLFNIKDHRFSGTFPEGLFDIDIKKFNIGQNRIQKLGRTDVTDMIHSTSFNAYRNDIEGQQIIKLDWSRLNSPGGPRDETLAEQWTRFRFEGNRYVFQDMLYVPDNAPSGEPAIELFWQLADQGVHVSFGDQRPAGPTNTYSVGGDIVIDDHVGTYGHAGNSYQWQKDGVDISDGSKYSGTDTKTLTITDSDSGDVGTYELVVTNSLFSSLADTYGRQDQTLRSRPITVQVTDAATDSRAGDEDALEALSASVTGFDASWDTPISLDNPPLGVTVESINGELRVTQINLRRMGLSGRLDVPELANLKEMTLWNSAQNRFDTQYPSALHQATSLEYLYITYPQTNLGEGIMPHNKAAGEGSGGLLYTHQSKWHQKEESIIRGTVGDDIDNLQNLKYYHLTWTDDWGLDGVRKDEPVAVNGIQDVSQNIWNIPTLESVSLYENWNIAGSGNDFRFPDTISHIPNLSFIYMGGGGGTQRWEPEIQGFVHGGYPSDMGELTNLIAISVGKNAELSGFPDLRNSLDLQLYSASATDTKGIMPEWMWDGRFHQLDVFSVAWPQGAKMSGEFPPIDPDSYGTLDLFNIPGHEFSGAVPRGLFDINPKKFNFGQNKFTSLERWDISDVWKNSLFRLYRNDIEGQPIPKLDWSRLNTPGGPKDQTLGEQYNQGFRLEENRYVFRDMLYVPDNAPNGEPAIELFWQLATHPNVNYVQFHNQQPAGPTNSYTVGGDLVIDDHVGTYGHPDNSYQWQKDGVDISDGSEYSGTNTKTLTILDSDAADAGKYELTVTNSLFSSLADTYAKEDQTLRSRPITVS